MPTPNKYHGSGRLYTAKEYRDRKHALRPTYLHVGYSADPLKAAQERTLALVRTRYGKFTER